MTAFSIGFGQVGIAFVTACGFAGSTWAFKMALDTQDFRWMTGAFGTLILSYIPYLALLGQSMSATIVVTSMMS